MTKKMITLFLAVSVLLTVPFQTITVSAATPDQDSTELRLQDILILILSPNIYKVVGDYYYPRILKVQPEIEPWRITVIDTKRLNGFRGFLLSITIEVEPSMGHHVPVGKDRITYQISVGPSVKLVKYSHLQTYELPSDLQEWVR